MASNSQPVRNSCGMMRARTSRRFHAYVGDARKTVTPPNSFPFTGPEACFMLLEWNKFSLPKPAQRKCDTRICKRLTHVDYRDDTICPVHHLMKQNSRQRLAVQLGSNLFSSASKDLYTCQECHIATKICGEHFSGC